MLTVELLFCWQLNQTYLICFLGVGHFEDIRGCWWSCASDGFPNMSVIPVWRWQRFWTLSPFIYEKKTVTPLGFRPFKGSPKGSSLHWPNPRGFCKVRLLLTLTGRVWHWHPHEAENAQRRIRSAENQHRCGEPAIYIQNLGKFSFLKHRCKLGKMSILGVERSKTFKQILLDKWY